MGLQKVPTKKAVVINTSVFVFVTECEMSDIHLVQIFETVGERSRVCALGEGSDKANGDNRERASSDFSLYDIKGWEGLW